MLIFLQKGKQFISSSIDRKKCVYIILCHLCVTIASFLQRLLFCVEKLYYYNWQLTSYVRSKSL